MLASYTCSDDGAGGVLLQSAVQVRLLVVHRLWGVVQQVFAPAGLICLLGAGHAHAVQPVSVLQEWPNLVLLTVVILDHRFLGLVLVVAGDTAWDDHQGLHGVVGVGLLTVPILLSFDDGSGTPRLVHRLRVQRLLLKVRLLDVLHVVEGRVPHDAFVSCARVHSLHPSPVYLHSLGTRIELCVAVFQPLLPDYEGEVCWYDVGSYRHWFPVQVYLEGNLHLGPVHVCASTESDLFL